MPISLLVQEQILHPPYTPSSPSLDMEAALDHFSSSFCGSELSSSPKYFDGPGVLMVDPFLDYLNDLMMDEQGEEDVPCMQDDVVASYNAIMSSLNDIVNPLNSMFSEPISDSVVFHENASGFHLSTAWNDQDLHADINTEVSLPACSNLDAHNGPSKIAHVSECVAARAISALSFNNGWKVQDQEKTSNPEPLPLSANSTAQPSSIDISLEEFKDSADYANLYVGKPGLLDKENSTDRATKRDGVKKESSRAARKGAQSVRNASAEVGGFVDLRELLVSCAQAVAIGDVKRAREFLQELYQVHGASVKGNALQRVAHYFCDALIARMGGLGGYQYKIMGKNILPVGSLLRASRMWYELTPYRKIIHYFANQNILMAAEGATRLHILDYGMSYGLQWPCLVKALADREGGPPLLVITGIDSSKPHLTSTLEWLEENGHRLAAYAKTYNVPFQFHAIVSDQWEDIDPASLYRQESEVLVINCMKRLSQLADESVNSDLTISPRQKLFMSMYSLSPHLLLTAELNAACNSPFFVSRFREALYFYSNLMDMLDTVCGDNSDRLLLETRCYARQILNIVACEGAERVERLETYKQWDARIKRAGFELLPIPSFILSRSISYVRQHYHKDFFVHIDGNGWMLMGWKGRTIMNMSGWKPRLNK
ncbi:hypothetical protein L7F22_034891 [Adiantum nelumboides]|nr:hypothetical protein [Adiantum nelumboides]